MLCENASWATREDMVRHLEKIMAECLDSPTTEQKHAQSDPVCFGAFILQVPAFASGPNDAKVEAGPRV